MKNSILMALSEKTAEINDPELSGMIDTARDKLSGKYVPRAMVISNAYGQQGIIDTIGQMSGQGDFLSNCLPESSEPFSLSLHYGIPDMTVEQETVGELSFSAISVSLEWDLLEGVELVWYCGIPFPLLDVSVTEAAGAVCLVTNATMALPLEEKEWLRNTGVCNRPGSRIIISLYNRSAVNTQDDWGSLIQDISARAKSVSPDIGIRPSFDEAVQITIGVSKTEAAEQDWSRMQILNAMDNIESRIHALLQVSGLDLEKLQQAVEDMKQERKRMEMSGKLVGEGAVENMYTNLKVQLTESVDQYNADAYESIRKRIESTKDIRQDVENIQPYLQAAWANFEREIGNRLSAEQEAISVELQRQIEQDGYRLVGMLESVGPIPYSEILAPSASTTSVNSNSMTKSGKREKLITRGMLITSIALAFVQPVLGLSALVGTQMFQHYKKTNDEELRRQVLNDLYSRCEQIKTQMLDQILDTIETAKAASRKNVGDVYARMLEEITAPALEAVSRIESIRTQAGKLQEILDNEIPAIRNAV